MIIQKIDDYFLVKVYQENMKDFNIYDIDDIKIFFQKVLKKIIKIEPLNGLINVDIYVNSDYGMIVEINPVYSYIDEIDIKIHIHLDSIFLTIVDINNLLNYQYIYYYKDNFYGNYLKFCDNEVLYKDTDDIINKGIKVF